MDADRPAHGNQHPAIRGGDEAVLRAVVDEAAATVRDDRVRFRMTLVYPVVVGILALLGTLWSTAANDRLIRDLETSFREPPIPGSDRSWPGLGPVEGAVLAAGFAVALVLATWIMRRGRALGRHAGQAARCYILAVLAGGDASPAERDRIASDLVVGIGSARRAGDSPLIAMVDREPDIDSRAATLRAAAGFFQGLDARQRRRARLLVPIVGCLIAGLAVLMYGVALFRPMTSLFESLAEVHEPIGRGGGR